MQTPPPMDAAWAERIGMAFYDLASAHEDAGHNEQALTLRAEALWWMTNAKLLTSTLLANTEPSPPEAL